MLWWNLRRLKSSDVQTRRRAIKSLSKSRSPRALAALRDESHLTRKEAAEALGEIGDAQAVKPLINLIEGSVHYALAKAAVGALERVLVRVAASVASKDVQVAAAISDVSGIYKDSQPYDWTRTYRKGQTMAHPTFRFGEVMAVIEPQKIDVLFSDKVRRLIHSRAQS